MVDPRLLDRIVHWALFAVLFVAFALFDLLPLGAGIHDWPAPAWALLVAIAWVVRRPDYIPLSLFAVLAFLLDLLLMRPPGLFAALSVVAVEFLRSRAHAAREWPFLLEWLVVGTVLLVMVLGNRLVQGIFALPQPRFGLEMQQFISNMIVYPVIVGLSGWLLRVRRLRPGEESGAI